MSFKCPGCSRPGSLEILGSISLPPDARSDEIILQVLACSACRFRGLAIYEESRRGALESEAWDHTGYQASTRLVEWVEYSILRCPKPEDAGCTCAGHQELGRVDALGYWRAPEGIEGTRSFPMHLSAREG